MMRSNASVLLILYSFLLFGCAGRIPDYEGREPSPELLNEILTTSWEQIDRLEATLTLTVQNPEFSGSLFGTLHLDTPAHLALVLKAPFGIKLGEITVSDGRYEAIFASGQLEQGNVEDFDLAAMTGIPVPAGDLLRLFEPVARPAGNADSTVSFNITGSDSLWQWRVAENQLEHQFLYNPDTGWIEEERWFDADSDSLALMKRYTLTDKFDNILAASELLLESGGSFPTKVRVTFETMKVNPDWRTNPFQLKVSG